jgi:hypothetical protein
MVLKYKNAIEDAEKINWRINDILPNETILDFSAPFLPESLTRESQLNFLSTNEKKTLNLIRGTSYLNLFAFVEEYISSLTTYIAANSVGDDKYRLRALLKFSEEEVKHQTLFLNFVAMFKDQFESDCTFLNNAEDVANIILSHSELSVLILTYHLELITQKHYVDSVKSDVECSKLFKDILHKHWLEESQHAKLDLYEIKRISSDIASKEFLLSLKEYFLILESFCSVMKVQVEMNLSSLENCLNKEFSKQEKELFIHDQLFSYIHNFILLGLENKTFRQEMESICSESVTLIDEFQRILISKYGSSADDL